MEQQEGSSSVLSSGQQQKRQNLSTPNLASFIGGNDGEFAQESMEAQVSSLEDAIESVFLQCSSQKSISGKLEPEFEKIIKFLRKTQKKIVKLNSIQIKVTKEVNEYTVMTEKTEKTLEKEQLSLQEIEDQTVQDQALLKDVIERAQGLKDKIKLLKKENTELVSAIKEGVQLSSEQQEQLQELMDYKSKLTFDLEDEMKRIVLLRASVSDIYEKHKVLEDEKQRLELEISDLKEKDIQKRRDIERETRVRDNYDKELKSLRVSVSSKQTETKAQQETISQLAEENQLLEIHINNQNQLIQQFIKEKESTLTKIQKMAEESKEQSSSTTRLEEENALFEREVKEKLAVYSATRAELKRNTRSKDNVVRRVNCLEMQRMECEEQKRVLRDQNDIISADIESIRKTCEHHKKLFEDLNRERAYLQSLLQKSQKNTHRSSEVLQVYQQMKTNYEMDLYQQNKSIREYDEKIKVLNQDRQSIIKESLELQKNYVASIKTLKEREEQIFDYRKKMTDVERKLKHQQALYEAVQNDRNIYSKHLLDSQNDIHQMKRRLKTMYYQINNYKEEIKSKSANLQRCSAENEKLNEDIKDINQDIKKLKHQNELSQAYIRKQTQEESSLIQFVKNADLEKTKQEHALQLIVAERDNLSSQVIRQNYELTKVYDRLRVLHSSLRHTDAALVKVGESLKNIQVKVVTIRRSRNQYKSETSDTVGISHLKTQLEYELMIEDMKCRTIKRETLMPLNIHRWRQLESTNPKLYELILLLHGLQRRLVRKREEGTRKDKEIEETEKMFLQLKSLQSIQVGAEAIEQIKQFQSIVKDKKSLYKSISSQLQLFKAQIRENEYLRSQVEKDIAVLKRKYLRLKMNQANNSALINSDSIKMSNLVVKSPLMLSKDSGEHNTDDVLTTPLISENYDTADITRNDPLSKTGFDGKELPELPMLSTQEVILP